jgi:hypothetical protein
MDASQYWYREIVYSGANRSFASFLHVEKLAKCSEALPNIILVPMELNECFASLVPRNSAFMPETHVFHLFTSQRLAKCSETLPNIILGPID